MFCAKNGTGGHYVKYYLGKGQDQDILPICTM